MSNVTAQLNNFRQAPRKMRMVVSAVRGKKVSEALVNLEFMAKKASLPIRNLIKSAVANARDLQMPTENLVIYSMVIDAVGAPIGK